MTSELLKSCLYLLDWIQQVLKTDADCCNENISAEGGQEEVVKDHSEAPE